MKSCKNTNTRLFVIFLLSICLGVSTPQEENEAGTTGQDFAEPEVRILQGPVRGVTMSTRNNRTIAGFLGIPYAKPPLGNLRFKAPEPVDIWNETLDAAIDTPDCIQFLNGEVVGNEDCLHLNVYTPWLPSNQSSELLPVMTYILGGAFREGSNNSTYYSPEFLLDKDVVLVVPSFRLGPLGFLSTGDAESPGNWGLKDIIFALKWVRDNVKFFGGDSKQVTIFGNSSGGMTVELLALSDLTIGLFHRYITQSGPALATFAYQPSEFATKAAFRLGEYVGCSTNTSAILVKCLRALDASELVGTAPKFIKWGQYPFVTWQPTVEPDLDGAVLTHSPVNLLATGKLQDLPHIVGSIPGDGFALSGYFYANPNKFEELLEDFDNIFPYVMNYYDKVKNVSAYTSALKSYYFNDDLTTNRSMILSNLTMLCGDLYPKFPNYEELHRASANNSTYLYSFEYRGTYDYSYFWTTHLTNYGAAHCDELLYLFPHAKARFGGFIGPMSEPDFKMVLTMVELWTSFATTGKPESSAMANDECWLPCSTQMDYLRIGNDTDLSLRFEGSKPDDQMLFLRNLDASLMSNYPSSFLDKHPVN